MGFKPSEKVLVALRGVYNLPFYLDDPVFLHNRSKQKSWPHLKLENNFPHCEYT